MSDLTESIAAAAPATKATPSDPDPITPGVLEALRTIALEHGILEYDLQTYDLAKPENSYGKIMHATLTPTKVVPSPAAVQPFVCILKISPKDEARRSEMNVVGIYRREAFMYEKVLSKYATLRAGENVETRKFDLIPHIYQSSIADEDEFLIFEDLTKLGFTQIPRADLPSLDSVEAAMHAIAKLHSYSFALEAQQPQEFASIIAQLDDNLFTEKIDDVSVAFARKSLVRPRAVLEKEMDEQSKQYIQILLQVENNYKELGLRCVKGETCKPYAVICHGDFWTNNIMYKYDSNKKVIATKVIDFQLSRYASPVLDVLHFLCVCTEKVFRDSHFKEMLQVYHDALAQNLRYFGLDPTVIYPKSVFDNHIREYGPYGLLVSAFAIPFFISNEDEIPDLDHVARVVKEHNRLKDARAKAAAAAGKVVEPADAIKEADEVVKKFDFINERTLPILNKRMTGIVADLIKYDALGVILKLKKK